MNDSDPLLREALPELAQELEELLAKEEPEIAIQVCQLRIVDRCRCGDDFCAMFYTVPRPKGSWGVGHRNISLGCKTGMLILDVVNDKVAAVEVLHRDDIRKKLNKICSLKL